MNITRLHVMSQLSAAENTNAIAAATLVSLRTDVAEGDRTVTKHPAEF